MVDSIRVLDGEPLGVVLEALLLEPRHVQYIGFAEYVFQGLADMYVNPCATRSGDDMRRHGEHGW